MPFPKGNGLWLFRGRFRWDARENFSLGKVARSWKGGSAGVLQTHCTTPGSAETTGHGTLLWFGDKGVFDQRLGLILEVFSNLKNSMNL